MDAVIKQKEDWLFDSEYPMLRWLEANGYKDLQQLQGDMPGWEKAGLPVQRPGQKPTG